MTLETKRRRPRISDEQKERVKMFALAGMTQAAIARQVGIAGSSVAKIRGALGLSTRSTEPLSAAEENKICRLRRDQRLGSPAISRQLKIPHHRVIAVLQARCLVPKPGENGCRYPVSPATLRAIRREFRAFERKLAAKYNVSETWIKRAWRWRK